MENYKEIKESILKISNSINKRYEYEIYLNYCDIVRVCEYLILDVFIEDWIDDMSSDLNKIRIFLKNNYESKQHRT